MFVSLIDIVFLMIVSPLMAVSHNSAIIFTVTGSMKSSTAVKSDQILKISSHDTDLPIPQLPSIFPCKYGIENPYLLFRTTRLTYEFFLVFINVGVRHSVPILLGFSRFGK